MSIDNKMNSRSRVLMLAIMMVASSFAVIGNSAAGPNGTEVVHWEADNGYAHTDADGSFVYVYEDATDADMSFTASELADGENYLLSIELWRINWTSWDLDLVSMNNLTWTAGDTDGDGVIDNVTGYLDSADVSSGDPNGDCYDAIGTLFHEDAAGGLVYLDSIGQLIATVNETSCESGTTTGPMEWVSVTHSGATTGVSGIPHFADVASASVQVGANDLVDTISYYFEYELDEFLLDGSQGGTTSGQYIDGANGNHSEDLSQLLWADGCYIISAYLFDDAVTNLIAAHYGEMFTVGDESACDDIGGGPSPDGPEMYVWTDDGYYQTGEEIIAHFAADYLDDAASYSVNWTVSFYDSVIVDANYAINSGNAYHMHNETLTNSPIWDLSEEGCYVIDAYLYDPSTGVQFSSDWFVFVIDAPETETPHCEDGEGPGENAYVLVDHPFDPDTGQFDAYSQGEDVNVVGYGAWGLEPNTTYSSILLVLPLFGEEGSFTCDDGEEIPADFVDDGDEDCADGSDENGPVYICADGEEIPFGWVNDDWDDCSDGSDEYYNEAAPANYVCADGVEVPFDYVNDGYEDCADGSDESFVQVDESVEGMIADSIWSDFYNITADVDGVVDFNGVIPIGQAVFSDDGVYGVMFIVVVSTSADGIIGEIEMGLAMICYDISGDFCTPPDECPFDETNPDNPCQGVEECDPMSEAHDEAACEQIVMEYCENYPDDPGCDMGQGECPFDESNTESPCYVEECDPSSTNHDESACYQMISQYCADNPEDLGCDDMGGPGFDLHDYRTGEAHFSMHFEHFEYWDDEMDATMSYNGILELVSGSTLDASVRDFIDSNLGDGNGEVNVSEALAFQEMMSQGMNDDCPFDEDHPDSPCHGVEECDPSSAVFSEDACNQVIQAYCAANPDDEGCQLPVCPFNMSAADSPCYEPACDPFGPDHNVSACDEAVAAYCYANDDPACEPPTKQNPPPPEEDEDDGHLVVDLDGSTIGEPHYEWFWIENMWGPVDGSDGLDIVFYHGLVWELDLGSWADADTHTVILSDDIGDLVSPCQEDEPTSGTLTVHDSYSWTPDEPTMATGWTAEENDYGYTSSFDCTSESLESLIVVFRKTVDDYNGDNFDEGDYDEINGEMDMPTNSPPMCHVFIGTATDDLQDAEESFEAPDGDLGIDLVPGIYHLYAHCSDADGDMVSAEFSVGENSIDFLDEGEGFLDYSFTLVAGMPDINVGYAWASAGGHAGSGTVTVHVIADTTTGNNTDDPIINDDGTVTCPAPLVVQETTNADGTIDYECVSSVPDDVEDLIDQEGEESGGLPGFTTALSIMSMLGAVFVLGRRKVEL